MPTFGEEKQRDMIKSVLPSTRRRPARADLRIANRRARRNLRQQINAAPDLDALDTESIERRRRHDVRDAVSDRRSGDKLGSIYRWAPAVTAHLPIEERMPYLTGMLGHTPMGRHALTHLEWRSELNPDRVYVRHVYYPDWAQKVENTHELLRTLMETGYHKTLNTRLKMLGYEPCCGHSDIPRIARFAIHSSAAFAVIRTAKDAGLVTADTLHRYALSNVNAAEIKLRLFMRFQDPTCPLAMRGARLRGLDPTPNTRIF